MQHGLAFAQLGLGRHLVFAAPHQGLSGDKTGLGAFQISGRGTPVAGPGLIIDVKDPVPAGHTIFRYW